MQHGLRARVGIGCAALLLGAPGLALAKTGDLFLTPNDALPATQINLTKPDREAPVTITADEMAADEPSGIVIARGHVEVMQGDSILTADQITYYQKTDKVLAEGNVTVLQPSGDVYFADHAELKDAMKRAVIDDFKARFADNSVLAANRAIKVNSHVTKLKSAAYTPCNLCATAAPFWQMNAKSATVDNVDERVTYSDAFLEMFGYPVFYTPYLSHPTPDARGKSGFFLPSYTTNPFFGSVIKAPYYWRISEDKDLTLTPWITTSEGPLLQFDYNQQRNAGAYNIQGSITNPRDRNSAGALVDGRELRGHIFAQGDEAVADKTYIGFDIKRASDDTYLRRYGFGDQQALFSRAYVERVDGRNFASLQGLSIQGLRNIDDQDTIPLALPVLQAYYETPADANGVRYHIAGDAQLLTRERGVDQARLSVTPGATLGHVTEGGQVLTASVNLRQDFYDTSDSSAVVNNFDGTTVRTLPQASLEWRYPLIRPIGQGSLLVEPIVLGVAQTSSGNRSSISNEDSRLLELSDTNIFSLERLPGIDLYDDGSRVAYGLRSHYYDAQGLALSGLFGQSYNVSSDTPFPNSTRAGEQFSDYIGRVSAAYNPFTLAYRFGLDSENVSLNRSEIELGFSKPWLTFSSSYRTLRNNRFLADSKEGIINATLPITEQWSIYGGVRRDFEIDQMVTANGGIIFKNECFNIMLESLRVYARDRDIAPSTEFMFRVAFKNLGEFGGQ